MWMKWRHKFAHGAEKEYKWYDLGEDAGDGKIAALDVCEELAQEYHWSDKYRGIDYELIALPPKEVIQAGIEEAEDKVATWTARAEYLRELLTRPTS